MANDVFVNGLEVACKAADGKSVASFPDPCWSPPAPSAGPVVIPYANTAYAKDLTNASKTVMITDKPVAQRDKSYFKTSTGNEAATNAFAKGYFSHAIKGKAYFRSWSMNVFVEGYNVCRHTDLMTHNHGSTTNTAIWHYLDTANPKGDCKKDARRISKACGEEYETDEGRKKRLAEERKRRANEGKGKGGTLGKLNDLVSFKLQDKGKRTWKHNHCKTLRVKPKKANLQKYKDQFDEVSNKLKQLDKININDIIDEAYDKAKEEIASYAGKAAAKVAAKTALKGWLGPIGWAWTAYDVIDAATDIYELYEQLDELKKEITQNIEKAKGAIPEIDKLLNKKDVKQSDIAEAMKYLAEANPCARARRCRLVSYKDAKNNKLNDKNGCCPGQTGHHLIPDSFMRDAREAKRLANGGIDYKVDGDGAYALNRKGEKIPKMVKGKARCKDYSTNGAPTMCVEGISSTDGSHGDAHKAFEDALGPKTSENISYRKTLNAAAKSAKKIAPQCDFKCIAKQLMKYYDDACGYFDGLKPDLRRASIPVKVSKGNDEVSSNW